MNYLGDRGDIGDGFLREAESEFAWNNQLIQWNGRHWRLLTTGGNRPSPRAAASVALMRDTATVVLFGGRSGGDRLNDLYLLDMTALVWTKM